jgi:dihydropteroate synthase
VSDPRKNMLIDIKNESKEEEAKILTLKIDDIRSVEVENIPKKASIIAVKEFKKYTDPEQ